MISSEPAGEIEIITAIDGEKRWSDAAVGYWTVGLAQSSIPTTQPSCAAAHKKQNYENRYRDTKKP